MVFDFLSKYFPPPLLLNPRRVGVSFSDSSIKAVDISGRKSNPDLKHLIIPLEEGIIVNGKVVKSDELVKKILLIKEITSSKFMSFVIPDELAYVFSVSLPIEKSKDITENVAFTIEENVPLTLSETLFDFKPENILVSDSKFVSETIVVASVKKEINNYIECIKNAGFDPLGCIHESQAIANSLIPKSFNQVSSIVQCLKDRFGIYLIKNGSVHFATSRAVLGVDYKDQFLDEYTKFLEYSLRYGGGDKNPISAIFVCGDFEYAKKVVDALVSKKDDMAQIKLSNVWSNILQIDKITPSIPYEASLGLAAPIGSILSDIK